MPQNDDKLKIHLLVSRQSADIYKCCPRSGIRLSYWHVQYPLWIVSVYGKEIS